MPADPQKQLIDAFTALTNQLIKLNDYNDTQAAKAAQSTVMEHPERTAQAIGQGPTSSDPALRSLENLLQSGQAKIQTNVSSPTGNAALTYSRGDQDLRQAALMGFAAQRQQPAELVRGGQLSTNASTPDNFTPQNPQGPAQPPKHFGEIDPNQAFQWALLGEHGGPALLRNFGLDFAGFGRSLNYAQTLGQGMANSNNSLMSGGASLLGLGEQNSGPVGNLLNMAIKNPMGAYLGYKAIQGGIGTVSAANDTLANFQQVGQQFGYGPPAGGQAIFGFRNPLGSLSPAASVGGAANIEAESLTGTVPGMGWSPFNDMTRSQAQQAVQGITSQGFAMNPINPWMSALSAIPGVGGTLAGLLGSILGQKVSGDAGTIARGLNQPLSKMYGQGLSQSTINEFDPLLRNSATSVQQLKETLSNLGIEAKATKETVDQFAASVLSAGEGFESMGSTPQGGVSLATQFTNATGLDPAIAQQIAQNPMMQGLILGQYGILPSGIGDMNGGAFTNSMSQVVRMMAGGLKGLDVNRYETINGHRVETSSGVTQRNDQIGQMLGIPSTIVSRLLGDQSGNTGRADLETLLGTSMNPLQGTLWSYINAGKGKNGPHSAAYRKAMDLWNNQIEPEMQAAGISPQRIQHIDARTGLRGRANALANAITTSAKNQHMNQLAGTTGQENQIKVTVGLTPAANKLFTISGGPSSNKKVSNAGGASISSVVNTPTNDLSNLGYLSGLGNTQAGSIYGSGLMPGSTATEMP